MLRELPSPKRLVTKERISGKQPMKRPKMVKREPRQFTTSQMWLVVAEAKGLKSIGYGCVPDQDGWILQWPRLAEKREKATIVEAVREKI